MDDLGMLTGTNSANADTDKMDAMLHNGALPGEALTKAPGRMPYDRPARESDPKRILDKVFNAVMQPKLAARFLGMMKAKIPLDIVSASLVQFMAQEGHIPITALPLVLPPITVMLFRMSEAAGIDPVISSDNKELEVEDIDIAIAKMINKNDLQKAIDANAKSQPDLKGLESTDKGMALLQEPEGLL